MLGPKPLGQVVGHAWTRPEQEEAEVPAGAEGCERWDQINSSDGPRQHAALPPGGPDHAAAVGEAEVRGLEDARELPVFARPHHELGVHRGHLMAAAAIDKGFDSRQRTIHVDAIHAHAEHPRLPHGRFIPRCYGRGVVVMAATSTHGSTAPRLLTKSPSDSPP